MDISHNIPTRSARDRIIDLLEIGDTYPLTDLNVVADQLTVVYGGTAKIPIENAQVGVTYRLCDPTGTPLGEAFQADGQGAVLVIESPKVEDDVTYRLRATKKTSGSVLAPQESVFLDERAPVKVGIDTKLQIRFKEERTLSLLDRANANPLPSDPRLVAFGTSLEVQVEGTQEGVEYSLLLDGLDQKDSVIGDLGNVVLSTGPVFDDILIQVRATKKFSSGENNKAETTPLDAKLYLKVMADPGLAISVTPSSIIDYRQDATIMIANSQAGVKYQVYLRAIPDHYYVHEVGSDKNVISGKDVIADDDVIADEDAIADDGTIKVPVSQRPDVQIRKPKRSKVWRTPKDFIPLVDESTTGDGNDLKIFVGGLMEDTFFIVQAVKEHQVDPEGVRTIPSSICLGQVAAILVRPDPTRVLRLRLPVVGAQTGNSLQVSGGQPGVFYYFKSASNDVEFPLPAYFHKQDWRDETQNKGVGQLGIEIDFVVTDDPDTGFIEPAKTFPPLPKIEITSVATDSKLLVRMVKAQTAVDAAMARDALIAAVPAIRAVEDVIDYRSSARILIPASNPQDEYRLMIKGTLVKPAVTGDNADLIVETDPLTVDSVFEVVVIRLAEQGLPVERFVEVSVRVRPEA